MPRAVLGGTSVPWRPALEADMENAVGEVNVLPAQAECFALAQAARRRQRDQRPHRVVLGRVEQPNKLALVEVALLGAVALRALAPLQAERGLSGISPRRAACERMRLGGKAA